MIARNYLTSMMLDDSNVEILMLIITSFVNIKISTIV